ncbi:MAG: redoxin domain-containing protein [Acidobacteriota bacterium]
MTRLFCMLLLGGALFAQAPKTHLKVGDAAPDFTLPSIKGDKVTLSSFKGKSTVVLAFFPAAFTGGCTKEMTSFNKDLAKFTESGALVFGISTDNIPSQKYWATEVLKVEQPLLSDFSKKTAETYGILMPSGVANRATFVVDKDGKIQFIEEGSSAVDISGAMTACSRLNH